MYILLGFDLFIKSVLHYMWKLVEVITTAGLDQHFVYYI